jgi:hypothetical protein
MKIELRRLADSEPSNCGKAGTIGVRRWHSKYVSESNGDTDARLRLTMRMGFRTPALARRHKSGPHLSAAYKEQ